MSVMPPVSITDKAKEYISKGHIIECIDELMNNLENLSLSKQFFCQTYKALVLLRAKFERLNREKLAQMIKYDEYDLHCNNVSDSILALLGQMDTEIGEISSAQLINATHYSIKVEMTVNLDFDTTPDKTIQTFLGHVGKLMEIKPDELKIITKKKGSIVLEMEISVKALIKLKALAKIGSLKTLKDLQPLEEGWEWMDGEEFEVVFDSIKSINKSDIDYLNDKFSLRPSLDKARRQFENGFAKDCVETLKEILPDLNLAEPDFYRLKNDSVFLLGTLSRLERIKEEISERSYIAEWHKLFQQTMNLLLRFEAAVKEIGERETEGEKGLYKAELVLGLDLEKPDLEEIRDRILRIENILNVGGDPARITKTNPG